MKKVNRLMLIVSLAVIAALFGVGYAVAQEPGDADPAPAMAPGGTGLGFGIGPGRHGGPGRHVPGGEVIKVEGDTITVKTFSGEEKSVKVNDETRYRRPPDGEATLADVKVGENIGIIPAARPAEGEDPVARVVIIGLPDRGQLTLGEVVSVDGNKVVVSTAGGEKEIELPEITPGMRIGVAQDSEGTVRGLMYNPPERPADADEAAPEATEGGSAT